MDIGFSGVNRMTSPLPAGDGGVSSVPASGELTSIGEAASRRLSEDDDVRFQAVGRRFPGEIAQVSGEESVDEAALRRDDDLGNLVSKVFDSQTAAAALPPLGIENVL